ncbi:ankyrin repeat-containing domain protein [Astrocystis sublimbata]|nr:ankyrin repeat-containing domain protein [Astrocystis sublimbata]
MASNNWERYKPLIIQLYLVENSSLGEIITYMQEKHNFAKKKHQYVYQFSKWGVQKNSKKNSTRVEWQHISQLLQKRIGKQSQVTQFEVPVASNKVQRRLQRYANAIPTASEFRIGVSSSRATNEMAIRVTTPPIVDETTWPALPWFQFKNRILPALSNPSGLLNTFLVAIGSENLFDYPKEHTFSAISRLLQDPSELLKVASKLTYTIPDDSIDILQKQKSLNSERWPLLMASEMLKMVLFGLSNNNVPYDDPINLRIHDRLILHLVEAVSSTNPEILSNIFSGACSTTKAVKNAVYGSAVRRRDCAVVSRLLESGVDPYTVVFGQIQSSTFSAWRGLLHCRGDFGLRSSKTAMDFAANAADIRLAQILVRAGVRVNWMADLTLLDIAASRGSTYRDMVEVEMHKSVEFAQFIIDNSVPSDQYTPCSTCQRQRLLITIAKSISRSNNCLANFLTTKYSAVSLYGNTNSAQCRRNHTVLSGYHSGPNRMACTPLHLAIVTGNKELIESFLPPILSCTLRAPVRTVQQALIASCLAGDADLVSRIVASHPTLPALEEWPESVTPLVASAWNENTTISQLLLAHGAHAGPKPVDGISEASITPIHVAAAHANVSMVKLLIESGVDCNVHLSRQLSTLYAAPIPSGWGREDHQSRPRTPLQYALAAKDGIDCANLLVHRSNFIGGELVQAIDLGDDTLIQAIVQKGVDMRSIDHQGRNALDAAVHNGKQRTIVSLYFTSGGSYSSPALFHAIEKGIASQDYSLIRLLINYRPITEIDSYEASSIVLCIEHKEWDLLHILLNDPFCSGLSSSLYEWRAKYGLSFSSDKITKSPGLRGATPLCRAIYSGSEDLVQTMIQRGFQLQEVDVFVLMTLDPDKMHESIRHWFPLETMAQACLHALLRCSIYLDDEQKVLEYASLVDNQDMIPMYSCKDPSLDLYLPYDLQAEDPERTHLMLAAKVGNVKVITILLDSGAKIDLRTGGHYGPHTALQEGAAEGNFEVVKLLLDHGADVDLMGTGYNGATALQYASIRGHLSIARLLVSRGAMIDALPSKRSGRTALEGAAENGRLDMVQFLLGMGAKVKGRMRIYYIRALDFAVQNGHQVIADVLKEHGLWNDRDQTIHDRSSTFFFCDFHYDEEVDDWHLRLIKFRNDDEYSVGSSDSEYSVESSDSEFSFDQTYESGTAEIEDRADITEADESPSDDYEKSNWIQQEFVPYSPTLVNRNQERLDQITMPSRITELDETGEDDDAIESATHRTTVFETGFDSVATDQLGIWQQQCDFGVDSCIPETFVTDEHSRQFVGDDVEWEGPFSEQQIVETNEMFGVVPWY